MALADPPVLKSPRELLRAHYREQLQQKSQELSSGPLEGTRVVLMEDVSWILGEPFPPASDNGAEVATPARVVVWAICPRCGMAGSLAVELTPELRVDSHGGSLHLKAKSKPVSHLCGQLTIGGTTDGQSSFELEDIIGDDSEAFALGEIVRVADGGARPLVGPVVAWETDEEIATAAAELGEPQHGRQLVVADPYDSGHTAHAFPVDADRLLSSEADWPRCDFPFCPLALEHKGDHLPLKPTTAEVAEQILDIVEGGSDAPAPACEFPSCALPAGHDGPHDVAPFSGDDI